jgi:hypothetical protein
MLYDNQTGKFIPGPGWKVFLVNYRFGTDSGFSQRDFQMRCDAATQDEALAYLASQLAGGPTYTVLSVTPYGLNHFYVGDTLLF